MKKLIRFVLLLCITVFYGCDNKSGAVSTIFEDPNITIVKQGSLDAYPARKVETAVNSFLSNPIWTTFVAENGSRCVNVEGGLLYNNQNAKAVLQFVVYPETKRFEVFALEINGVPQNDFMQISLLEKMYSAAENNDQREVNSTSETTSYETSSYNENYSETAEATPAAVTTEAAAW